MVLHQFLPVIFTFIIGQVLPVEECQVVVSQPEEMLYGWVNESLTIPCHVNVSLCPSVSPLTTEVVWYAFKNDSHSQLDTNSLKYRLEPQHLVIHSLSDDDDGVYYCAVMLTGLQKIGAQAFGNGTTVTVKENSITTRQVLLVLLLGLLMPYSLSVLSFIFCIKTRGSTLLQGRLRTSQTKSSSTRRVQFGAVVQELYNNRNLHSNSETTSNKASSQSKNEISQSGGERESTYQNLHKTR